MVRGKSNRKRSNKRQYTKNQVALATFICAGIVAAFAFFALSPVQNHSFRFGACVAFVGVALMLRAAKGTKSRHITALRGRYFSRDDHPTDYYWQLLAHMMHGILLSVIGFSWVVYGAGGMTFGSVALISKTSVMFGVFGLSVLLVLAALFRSAIDVGFSAPFTE